MKKIIQGERVAEWVAKECGGTFFSDPYTAIGVEKDGEIIVGLVVNNYTEANVDISGAARKGALTPIWVRYCAAWIFGQLGAKRVSLVTRKTNRKACRFAVQMGCVYEGKAINWFGEGKDGRRYVLTRDRWRLSRV